MIKEEAYRWFANVPFGERREMLSNDYTNPLFGMTVVNAYCEMKEIDDKLREDEIRRAKLLTAIEVYISRKEGEIT